MLPGKLQLTARASERGERTSERAREREREPLLSRAWQLERTAVKSERFLKNNCLTANWQTAHNCTVFLSFFKQSVSVLLQAEEEEEATVLSGSPKQRCQRAAAAAAAAAQAPPVTTQGEPLQSFDSAALFTPTTQPTNSHSHTSTPLVFTYKSI